MLTPGTETYFTNIVQPWYEQPRSDVTFLLFCLSPPPWWQGEKPGSRFISCLGREPLRQEFLPEQVYLPLRGFFQASRIFSPGYVGSLLTNLPQVVTVHDTFAWVCPREIGLLRSAYWRVFIPLSVHKASAVIAVSSNTANDLQSVLQTPTDKVSVVLEAGGHLASLPRDETLLSKNQLTAGGYFHCVGFFKEIKNPRRILEAYQKYRDQVDADSCNTWC